MLDKILIREAKQEDVNFILSSWLHSYKTFSEYARRIRPEVFYHQHGKVLNKISIRPTLQIIVAHLHDDADTIVGYMVFEQTPQGVIHFVYVKRDWRLNGIAKKLMQASKLDLSQFFFTHWTYPMDQYIEKFPNIIYDPYRI